MWKAKKSNYSGTLFEKEDLPEILLDKSCANQPNDIVIFFNDDLSAQFNPVFIKAD